MADARNDATFVIVGVDKNDLSPQAERVFGKPARTHRLGPWEVLIYGKNVLDQLKPAKLPATS